MGYYVINNLIKERINNMFEAIKQIQTISLKQMDCINKNADKSVSFDFDPEPYNEKMEEYYKKNPKMNNNPALQLFGAGREKRIYAVPPYTKVKSLDFEDYPFTVEKWDNKACELCGATDSYLDEVLIDNEGRKMWICSDTDFCNSRNN